MKENILARILLRGSSDRPGPIAIHSHLPIRLTRNEGYPKFNDAARDDGQKVIENSQAAKNSSAAQLHQPGDPSTLEELAEWIKNGKAPRCAIASVPPGAEIYVDGLKVGVAPIVFVLLKRDAPRILEIRMAGYRVIEKRMIPDGQPIILGVDLEKQ